MKNKIWLGALLLAAVAANAQESRQDVSFSATGTFAPQINSGTGVQLNTNTSLGVLASYRYMVTPHSALEVNYSFTQYQDIFTSNQFPQTGRVHVRQEEATFAYVYTRNYRRYNPFLEVGAGGLFFTPLHDFKTTFLDTKSTTGIAALFGGGVAYELSPSFDIRAEYRGFAVKAPDFKSTGDILKTNRYEVISLPTIGVAYHF
jgi:outer membrane immunogenic protein